MAKGLTAEMARICGPHSVSRARRPTYFEERHLIVVRIDFLGAVSWRFRSWGSKRHRAIPMPKTR
jgi:hypothetical protein